MRHARVVPIMVVFIAACVSAPYEEAPQSREDRPRPAAETATVVGRVSPEGIFVADTLERAMPDTARVERETVVTGEIRPAADLETVAAPPAGERGEKLATGWRVQILAASVESDAAAAAERARSAAGGAPVYIEWDDPWFKVRVGDHSDLGEAERLRERLADLGWPEAWVVRTTIRTLP